MFIGEFPDVLYSLSSLSRLSLGRNALNGTLSHDLCELRELQHLDLAHNEVEGSLPSCIGDLAGMEFLSLKDNRVSGTIPASLATVAPLKHLDLSGNSLHGHIPEAFGVLDMDIFQLVGNSNLDPPDPAGPLAGVMSKRKLHAGKNRLN